MEFQTDRNFYFDLRHVLGFGTELGSKFWLRNLQNSRNKKIRVKNRKADAAVDTADE